MRQQLESIGIILITSAVIGVLYWIGIGIIMPLAYITLTLVSTIQQQSREQLFTRLAVVGIAVGATMSCELIGIPPVSIMIVFLPAALLGILSVITDDYLLLYSLSFVLLLCQITNVVTLSYLHPVIHPLVLFLINGGLYIVGNVIGELL